MMQKTVFGENFLLADSTRKIKWKITDETREVAGYTCRRANAIVMDSIYVVAFFAEKIHISGGPESFGGLPGMILELALPHENVIWRAVKVSDMAIPVNTVSPPKDGKTTDLKSLTGQIKDLVKNRVPREANLVMKINLL
jgi:GLPGLI family protein